MNTRSRWPERAPAQPPSKSQPQRLAYLPHRQSLARHSHPPLLGKGPGLPLVEDCQQHRPTVTLRNALMSTGNRCSRSTGTGVHDQLDGMFTIKRNQCSRSTGTPNVVTAPVRRGSPKRARPNGVPAATCPLDRARGLLASDRGQKPIGSGSIEPRELARNRYFSTVSGIGSHIYGIYGRKYGLMCEFRCRGGSKTVESRHAESVVETVRSTICPLWKPIILGTAGAKKRGLTVEPAVPEEHPFQELLSAWIG